MGAGRSAALPVAGALLEQQICFEQLAFVQGLANRGGQRIGRERLLQVRAAGL
jgi:hypothetical protein